MTESNANAPYEPSAGASQPPLTAAEDKQWASMAHFGGILNFIPPLIVWLVFKDRGAMTNREGKESLNFQITLAIAWMVFWIVDSVLLFIPILGWPIGLLLLLALIVCQVLFPILGGVKVNSSGSYRYPLNFRFIK